MAAHEEGLTALKRIVEKTGWRVVDPSGPHFVDLAGPRESAPASHQSVPTAPRREPAAAALTANAVVRSLPLVAAVVVLVAFIGFVVLLVVLGVHGKRTSFSASRDGSLKDVGFAPSTVPARQRS